MSKHPQGKPQTGKPKNKNRRKKPAQNQPVQQQPTKADEIVGNTLVKSIGKIILGLGLAGFVLWLNPMGLTDLLMTFGIPLLLIVLLLVSVGLLGSGTMELLKGQALGERVQAYVRKERAAAMA